MKSNFQERKDARIERYEELSEKADQRQTELFEESHRMVEHIPLGQPILVGHHSEKAHRRLLDRSWNKMGKGVEEGEKATYYAQRAQAAASNTAIFSDDPEAVQKLKAKIAEAENNQALMKAANKIIKNKQTDEAHKRAKLAELGLSEKTISTALHPPYYRQVGFAGFELTNNNANIRRMKQRLAELQKAVTAETSEEEINGITIRDSVEDNRVQIFFPDKPNDTIREFLKAHGFHWSRDVGAWMRHRSSSALYWAKEAAKQYNS